MSEQKVNFCNQDGCCEAVHLRYESQCKFYESSGRQLVSGCRYHLWYGECLSTEAKLHNKIKSLAGVVNG